MKKKTTIKLGALLLILAIMMSSLAGISAYFTDTDTATNTFTVGEVSIDLQEPSWKGDTDTTPNMTTPKDPQVLNDGVSDAFVFLEVSVPYADNIVIADADGTKNVAATAELFTYTIKDGWVEVGTPTTDTEAGVVKHVYAYIGDNASDLKALAANETTPTLFDEITFVNAVENQGLEAAELDVIINAYGIQTNDINGGKTDPAGVWEVITNSGMIETQSHGLYYGQPYNMMYDFDSDGIDDVVTHVFYEDGTYWVYSNGAPVNAWTYFVDGNTIMVANVDSGTSEYATLTSESTII